jgi:hypothetical protein
MRIGIDLDNTIISYDAAFRQAAVERGLLPDNFTGGKQSLRQAVRALPEGETQWQALQGFIYGKCISTATFFSGVESCIKTLRAQGAELFIVSHKTEFGHFDADRVNLRDAAKAWLSKRGILDIVGERNLFFAATREEKVERIGALALDWFIDDLPEVFADDHFPVGTQAVLFHTSPAPAPKGRWVTCREWDEVHGVIAAAQLLPTAPDYIARAGNGGNSRIYKLGAGTKTYALKRYPVIAGDTRDRMGTERMALQFFAQQHITCVPQWVAGAMPFALLSWIDGTAVTSPAAADIDAATAFLSRIFTASDQAPADMPLASEACFSAHEILEQVKKRAETLEVPATKEPLLAAFLANNFAPELATRETAARETLRDHFDLPLPVSERRLIAADFGFHNALRCPDNTLAFLDFEYFGWDDPVKMFFDFLMHPAQPLADTLKQRFYKTMCKTLPTTAKARFAALYPLFGLRWSLILLNEFLPERWQARKDARGETDLAAVKERQVEKAKAMLAASAKWTLT